MEWNQSTRLNQDSCSITLAEKQSQKVGSYISDPIGFCPCQSKSDYAHVMSEPIHQQKQYFSSCNIARDSQTKNVPLTNPREIHQLFTRPYLGSFRGAGQHASKDRVLETEILSGSLSINRKSTSKNSGVTVNRFQCLPEHSNPQRVGHVVESWVRGGEPSRDYIRKLNYEKYLKNKRNNNLINKGFE